MKFKGVIFALLGLVLCFAMPEMALATVQSSMQNLQTQLLGTVLPLLSVISLLFAGMAYLSGSPNSRGYLIAALIGTAIAFGADSIVSFIRSIVH